MNYFLIKIKNNIHLFLKCFISVSLILSFCGCDKNEVETIDDKDIEQEITNEEGDLNNENLDDNLINELVSESDEPKIEKINIKLNDEGDIIYYSNGYGYRYGPSIMKYDDESFDIWYSSPGNNSSQWDYIRYRHYDGEKWSNEQIALRPTPNSPDECSVCDPGLIYFNNYYYLAYTGTDYYNGHGTNNSAFVARSEFPDGPFEKWNGESWGGKPSPIIQYEGDIQGWGIGEISFVIFDEELFIYYTYFDVNGGSIRLTKADLSDDWPLSINGEETVCQIVNQDSLDVVYVDDLETFFAFSVFLRMDQGSKLILYESKDGRDFKEVDKTKTLFENYAHNIGVSKDVYGHVVSTDKIIVGYGYGANWGKWSMKIQEIEINKTYE